MTQGTAAEIIAEQGLTTWIVVGDDLTAISDALAGQPGVDQTAVFGSALHVTGKDGAALEATVRRVSAGSSVTIERADAGLEDVFIHLMTRSRDNFGDTP
jgi:ABC-2 type transport system ATP-binding protein